MTDTIVIGRTKFPTKTTVDGRPCTRSKCPEDYTVYDQFGRLYKGPFMAVKADGTPVPDLNRLDRVQTEDGEKTSFIHFDDIGDENECYIKDSTGRVVAVAQSYAAAKQIMCALNQMPVHSKVSFLLGMYDGHSLDHYTKEDRFAFWCIQLDPNTDDEVGKTLHRGYVMPLKWMFLEAPVHSRNPMSALRFRGVGSAMKAIELIQKVVLPSVKPESKTLKVWKWDEMKPVMVKYAYNVVK